LAEQGTAPCVIRGYLPEVPVRYLIDPAVAQVTAEHRFLPEQKHRRRGSHTPDSVLVAISADSLIHLPAEFRKELFRFLTDHPSVLLIKFSPGLRSQIRSHLAAALAPHSIKYSQQRQFSLGDIPGADMVRALIVRRQELTAAPEIIFIITAHLSFMACAGIFNLILHYPSLLPMILYRLPALLSIHLQDSDISLPVPSMFYYLSHYQEQPYPDRSTGSDGHYQSNTVLSPALLPAVPEYSCDPPICMQRTARRSSSNTPHNIRPEKETDRSELSSPGRTDPDN